MSWEVTILIALGALGWFWLDAMRVREHAIAAGRRASEAARVQFLDDTVALGKTRFARNDSGHLQFLREYRFEFSDTGDNRRSGLVRMLGERVTAVEMDGDSIESVARVVSIDD
jgi:hypothetical protein